MNRSFERSNDGPSLMQAGLDRRTIADDAIATRRGGDDCARRARLPILYPMMETT